MTTGLPCTHFRPARITDHFELSIIDRHARDFRLGRDVVEERRHRLLGIEHAFVHVDVDEVRAAAHLLERHLRRRGVIAGANQPREARRAGDVGPLADHLEIGVGPDRQGLEAGELREVHVRVELGSLEHGLASLPFDRLARSAAMCSGVVPQQPPTMFTKPLVANSRR